MLEENVMLNNTDTSPIVYARIAGILYLLIIFFGIYSEVFIRSQLIEEGDTIATAANVLASEDLFKFAFVADIIMLLSDVAIAVLFYMLLKPVSQTLALLAAIFRLTQASVLAVNLLNYYAALLLIKGEGYISTFFEAEQLHTLALFFLDVHRHGYDLGLIFFAFSCFILGLLIIKSEYFPNILGYGLMAAAVVYEAGSIMRFVYPEYLSIIEPFYIIPLIAELSFCLWLLVKGVRIKL